MKRAPGMLQAVCIIAIILGALGFFAAGFGIVGAVMGEAMQKMFTAGIPANSPQAQQQIQMQKDIKAVTDRWAPVTYALIAVQFVVVGCLIVGGVQAFRLQPSGHRLLLMAFLIAIAFDLMGLIPAVSMQLALADVMEKSMVDAVKASSGGRPMPPGAARIMQTSMKAGMYIGLAFAGFWALIKLGFYGYGTYYLRQPRIRGVYEPAAEIDWEDDVADAEEQAAPEDEAGG